MQTGELRAQGLTVRFGGVTALDDVSLNVTAGEVVGVIGPNGAGKTTLFNVICGFVSPATGELWWDGEALRGHRPHQLAGMEIARTLQGIGLFGGLTALENVMAGAHHRRRSGFASALLGLPRAARDERALRQAALEAMERLGVADAAARRPGELPYPVQKRVGIARALVARPRLLLLDEPAGGLGHEDIEDLADTIRSLRATTSVMLVEHHVDLVVSTCDRIVVLDFGRVIAEGTPDAVASDPRVLDAYLGVVPAEAGS